MKNMMKLMSAALLSLALAACGSAHSASGSTAAEPEYYGGDYGIAESNSYMADAPVAEAAAEYDMADSKAEAPAAEPTQEEETDAITGDMLVYTGSINLETLKYEDTVAAVRERIRLYNGIVEQENEWDSDRSWTYTDGRGRMNNRTLSMTLRIPTASFDSFMNDMEGAGKITARSQMVENISRKYSDNSIEIEALRKQQDRLLEMMDAAQTVEEMIMVEERLSEVQVELNRKLSYQSSMDTDVKYSTIYLNISEVQEYTPGDNKVQIGGFWKRLADAADNSWRSFVYFLQGLVIGLVNLLPFILLIGLIIFGIKRYRKAKGLDTKLFHWKKKGRLSKTEDAPQKAAEPVKEDAEPEDRPETK